MTSFIYSLSFYTAFTGVPDDPKVRDARILGFLHGYVCIRDWIRGTFRLSFARIAEVFFVDMCTYQIDTLGIYRGSFF